jgi:predicted nucleotidyltransferase
LSEHLLEHLTTKERRAVEAFLLSLQERFPGEILEVTLFGSKARGDSAPWSDIDILITARVESWPLRAEISTLAADVSLEYSVLIGPRVIGQQRWERMKEANLGLYKNIAIEGVPLPLPVSQAA